MILKILGVVSVLVCLHRTDGASYSKVYVQSGGSDVVPVEYVNYGAPVITEPQIARLSAAPLGSVVSSVIPPCVSPCVVGQNIAPVAPPPNAKFITYNAPNVPVVVAPSKDNGYEYSYIVYDENTGDRKAQREISDGSVVRGEYSFMQPDGYVREVQYRADDLTGFNVIVKRILPDSVGIVEKKSDKVDPPPCKEVKSEALKVEPSQEPVEVPPTESQGSDSSLNDDQVNKAEAVPVEVEVVTPTAEDKTPKEETKEEINDAPAALETESVPKDDESTQQPEPAQNSTPQAEQEANVEIKEPIVVQDPAAVTPVLPVPVSPYPASNLVISYDDIIRCLQTKTQAPQGLNISPLTYIILPAANRPC